MTEKHRVYPIFLPHAGCPFQCVYCNQRAVTSRKSATVAREGLLADFRDQLEGVLEAARASPTGGEIAFYGGTFTALPEDLLHAILGTVSPWVEQGIFTGIRFSTRPDSMTPSICRLLDSYPIRTVELGVQSLSDAVLAATRRGYGAQAVHESAARVQERGWQLGLQLMPGLPGDDRQSFLASVAAAIALRPDFVRLYPALVLPETILARWYREGRYRPLDLERAVAWCAAAYAAFLRDKIRVVRMGLHADPELLKPGAVVAGPWHPAFGYLVRVRWWRERVDARIAEHLRQSDHPRPAANAGAHTAAATVLTIRVAQRLISEALGPQRSNVHYWCETWRLQQVRVVGEPSWTGDNLECRWE